MKTVILFGIFAVSSSIGYVFSKEIRKRNIFLTEIISLLKTLSIKISNKIGSLDECLLECVQPNMTKELCEKWVKAINMGYLKPLAFAMKEVDLHFLTKEDINIIRKLNMNEQSLDAQLTQLKYCITELEHNLQKSNDALPKSKAVLSSGVLIGLALVIIFI